MNNLESALAEPRNEVAELTTQVQEKTTVLQAKTEQLQAQTTQLQAKTDELQEKTKELQTYTGWQAGMDSKQDLYIREQNIVRGVMAGATEFTARAFSVVTHEAKTWGPLGTKQVLKTAYSLTQKNPLASVRDASVLLTPLAIEHFVMQSMKENSTANYLDDAAGAWKQVLSKLEGDSIGLRTEQKVGLVVSFVKQFAVAGKFGLEKEKSREMIHSVLDSLEPNQALKSLLTNIRKQSRSASETVMQYLLDKHDEAVQTNQTNKQLPTQEVQRLRNILGIKTPLQPVHAFDHTRIAALKVGQTIRPAWANTATLAAAITRRPVNDAINKVKADRELQVQKMQNKLEASKALYERVNGMKNKRGPR